MKIDKAPVPLIVPNPDDPGLTERVTGTDQTGATIEIQQVRAAAQQHVLAIVDDLTRARMLIG